MDVREYAKEEAKDSVQDIFNELSSGALKSRWQGKSSLILELSLDNGSSSWRYYTFEDPTKYQELKVQSRNNSETIFFNSSTTKYLRVTDDGLFWSYYAAGPFHRLEDGSWIKNNATEHDAIRGIIQGILNPEKNKNEDKEQKGSILFDLDALKQKAKLDPTKVKENEKAWKELEPLFKKLDANQDVKNFRESILQTVGKVVPEIKSNEITGLLEEILSIYEMDFEYNYNVISKQNEPYFFPIENKNNVKFILGVILTELSLYPKTFLQDLGIKFLVFCGEITLGEMKIGSKFSYPKLYLNCNQRNIIKIQQSFHEGIFDSIVHGLDKQSSGIIEAWKSLNPPDFTYDKSRKMVTKGLNGFLSLRATQDVHLDMGEIYFVLVKNPPTILNHSDACVAQKGHFLKNVLEAIYPNSINEQWWKIVTEYKDIMEIAMGSTDYFRKARFESDEINKE